MFPAGYSSAQSSRLTGKTKNVQAKPNYETTLAYVQYDGAFQSGAIIFHTSRVLVPASKFSKIDQTLYDKLSVIVISTPDSFSTRTYNVSEIIFEPAPIKGFDITQLLAVIKVSSTQSSRLN